MNNLVPILSIVPLFAAVTSVSSVAEAAVPGWARTYRTTQIDVVGCMQVAQAAMEEVTGKVPTVTSIDANTKEIRSSTTNVGIFAYCTADPGEVCDKPKANLIILTFSSSGSTDAANKRDAFNDAFGNPIIIDCGIVGNPI
jgi:hypothetical protein